MDILLLNQLKVIQMAEGSAFQSGYEAGVRDTKQLLQVEETEGFGEAEELDRLENEER